MSYTASATASGRKDNAASSSRDAFCTARTPRCADCPLANDCRWRLSGKPPYDGPPRRGQTYAGTDRQCRGRLLAVLRHAEGPVEKAALDDVWSEPLQRERALAALIEDGLVDPLDDGRYTLPR